MLVGQVPSQRAAPFGSPSCCHHCATIVQH